MTGVKRGTTNKTGNSSWDEEAERAQNSFGNNPQDVANLASLFSSTSMTSENRNLVEVGEVLKIMKENYKQLAGSTTPQAQLNILPDLAPMTSQISNILPGMVLSKQVNDAIWVMGVLFSNKLLTISSEPIRINNGGMGASQISIPLTPVSYANKEVIENLRKHFTTVAAGLGLTKVNIINMTVVDLEMLNHPEAGDVKDRPTRLAAYLANQWETSFLTKVAMVLPAAGIALPSPFKDPKQPYGKDGYAEARVSAIQDRVNKAGYLTAANMEVVASTTNNLNNSASVQTNSKEIARVTATVQLSGITYQAHMANLAQSRGRHQNSEAIQTFLGMNGGSYQNGYRPMHPVITMESAQAGEMMNYNQGLFPYFYGLYLIMSTNAEYVFTEALRRTNVGSRGNLSALESRIDMLLQGVHVGVRPVLNDKTITDTDVVNQWIRTNVSPHATFRTNIITNGPDGSVNNFLLNLASKDRVEEIRTMVAVLDAMSNNVFSKLLERNREAKSGWTIDKPALHRTQMIVVNGLAKLGNKELNTLEVDEMLLGHVKGKNGQQAITNYLGIQYGSTQDDFKARCQKLRVELNQSLFDGNVHINSFAQSCVWDPQLMSLIGEAMDTIGTLNVANTTASFRPNSMVYMPGGGLATVTTVGSNNVNNINAIGAFNGGVAFG